jgi:thioredoxin-related protein
MTPIVDGIRRNYGDRLNVLTVSLDESVGKELAREHGVFGTPTLLLLDEEGTPVNVLRGLLPAPLIEQAVADLVAG